MKSVAFIFSLLCFAVSAQAQTLDANGWTVLAPSADSRLVYVSSSSGLDTNNGLTEATPKQTIAAGKALLRDLFPDRLLLKCGDTFPTQQIGFGTRGRSATEPLVVTSYGSGERPILSEVKFAYNGPTGFTLSDVWFVNLDMRGNASVNPGNANNGAAFFLLQSTNRILIEGCVISGYTDGMSIQQSSTWPQPNGNMTIRRNVIKNNLQQGLLLTYQDTTLLEENIFDRNGYGLNGTTSSILTHNCYIGSCKNLSVRNNIFSRASNFGTKMSCDTPGVFSGFTVENNLYYDCGLSLDHSAGSSGDVNTTFTHEHGVIQNNVFTELNKLSGGVQQDLAAYVLNTNDVLWSGNVWFNKSAYLGNQLLVWGEHHKAITVENSVVHNWAKGTNPSTTHFETNSNRIDGYTLINNRIDLTPESYVDSSRTLGSYYASVGGSNDPLLFIAAANNQSKANWNPSLTANAVNSYVRAGFVAAQVEPPIDPPIDPPVEPPVDPPATDAIDKILSGLRAAAAAFIEASE